jgi:hypothetical protein
MNRIEARIPPIDLWRIRFSADERHALVNLYQRGDLKSRRLAVDYLDEGVGVPQNRRFIFEMCDRMIPDRSEYVRWTAFRILGEYAQTHPEQLWPLVLKWGTVKSYDIRAGIACLVLEHILEYHFDRFFAQAVEYVEEGHRRFAYTLAYCAPFGQTLEPANAEAFNSFVGTYFPKWLSRRRKMMEA